MNFIREYKIIRKRGEVNTDTLKVIKVRKLGPTELTWEEKNSSDYRYYPDDNSILLNFIKQNLKMKGEKNEYKRKSK